MEQQTPFPRQLNDSVYEFYRPVGRVEVEYVFFHGLCFNEYQDAYKSTWEVQDGGTRRCLLRDLIPISFPRARVLSVSYDACAQVSDEVGRMSFSNLGILLVHDIIHLARVGQRECPVVLVGYCLGGLILKQLCTEAKRQFDQAQHGSSTGRLDKFLTNVRVTEFVDTPHSGVGLTDFLRHEKGCKGPVLEYLDDSSVLLEHLNNDFDSLATESEWERFCWWYCRKAQTWDMLDLPQDVEVVSEHSARRGMDKHFCTISAAHTGKALVERNHWNVMEESRLFISDIIKIMEIRRLNRSVYEFYQPDGECQQEFVFFHGLCLSDVKHAYKKTWQLGGESGYWIRDSISDKFPEARVLAVSYDSRARVASFETPRKAEEVMRDLGRILVNDIIHVAKVGQRGCPVILVGHCVGGLVIKQVCIEAKSQLDNAKPGFSRGRLTKFLKNVQVIEYLDTPHGGSKLGAYLKETQGGNGPLLEYLTDSSAPLEQLNQDFENLMEEGGKRGTEGWKWEQRFVWYSSVTESWESLQLPGIQVVEEKSAKQGDTSLFVAVDTDHCGRSLSSESVNIVFNIDTLRKGQNHKFTQFHDDQKRLCNPLKLNNSLYEIYRPAGEDIEMEIIFFPRRDVPKGEGEDYGRNDHDYKNTWMSEDGQFWLQKWLPDAFPKALILSVSYSLPSTQDLFIVAENLIQEIVCNKARSKTWHPTVLVGHSSGGLVIKELCNEANKHAEVWREDHIKDFLRNVQGIAFYGTSNPRFVSVSHEESPPNLWNRFMKKNPSCQGDKKDLPFISFDEREVQRTNISYKHLVSDGNWKELALYETRPTKQGSSDYMITHEYAARSGIQSNSFLPLSGDHFTICRPKSKVSNSFQYLVHFIRTTMNEAQYVNMNVRRKKRRGIAIIISMEKGRLGSKADCIRLEEMAEYTSLKPITLRNVRAAFIRSIIPKILETELNKEDECVLCCVAAHGCVRDGKQFIYDDEQNSLEFISDILEPISKHPPLAGKPKVFVVNACRVSEDYDATAGLQEERNDLKGLDDCLLMYSTELYTFSTRKEDGDEEGSLLFTDLTYHMRLLYQNTDVQDIFQTVQEKVAEEAGKVKVYQCPVIHSSLKKRLSWRPR
ncbi:hypothetical protein Mapa_003498 [Marchantia paleacea]|nr:hypothetical protein Mapa_003498 [Marchantia paleacea]